MGKWADEAGNSELPPSEMISIPKALDNPTHTNMFENEGVTGEQMTHVRSNKQMIKWHEHNGKTAIFVV